MNIIFLFVQIDRRLMQARNMTNRVKNEIKVHIQLKHPSVLQLYNCFEDENYVYLVIELCHNGELNRFLKTKQKKLKEPEGMACQSIGSTVLSKTCSTKDIPASSRGSALSPFSHDLT